MSLSLTWDHRTEQNMHRFKISYITRCPMYQFLQEGSYRITCRYFYARYVVFVDVRLMHKQNKKLSKINVFDEEVSKYMYQYINLPLKTVQPCSQYL